MRPTMVRWLAAAFVGVIAVQAARVPRIPGGFILEYEDDYDPSAVLDDIKRKYDVEVRQELHFKLFKGAHVVLRNLQASDIRDIAGVKNVWPSKLYARPKTTAESIGNGDMGHGHGAVKRDVEHDTFSPHVMTQVNLLRDAGFVGKGFKVAVIDSGIDFLHPALGGGFGPGHVVSFGADLVGDDYNGTNTPVPGPYPLDCDGHGTHVAGIMAAQPDKNPYGIIGAASGANLGGYRVFGCEGFTDDGILIAAYHQAFEAGADVIHASIGEPRGWSESAWAVAVSTIVAHGVPCTLSVGNDGSQGLFYMGDAADAIGAAAVGSVDNVLATSLWVNATYSVKGGDPVSFGFTPGLPKTGWTAKTLPLWTPITNVSDIIYQRVGCDPFPDTTPNLGGYIVLLPKGGCDMADKTAHAASWGAKLMLIYNDPIPGTRNQFNATKLGMPIGVVTHDQGVEWVNLLQSGNKVDVNMVDVDKAPVVLVNINNTQNGGHMSTYTSWGPTWELAVKPQFSAPGRDILSTWPRGSYAVDSGTSFAGPLVAAMYVLLMEATGIRDAGMLGRLLSATAKQLDYSDGLKPQVGVLAPVPQQGAGMAQVFEASRARTVFDVDSLAFNDTAHFVAERNFTIINLGNDTLQYRLDHTPALTAYTFFNDEMIQPDEKSPYYAPDLVPNELVNGSATLEFSMPPHDGANASDSPESFSIPGGKQRVVSVRVTRPRGLDHVRVPVWSGFIRLTGNDGSKLSLPYQGVSGSLRNHTVLDVNNTGLAGTDLTLLLGPRTFLLPPPGKANLTRWSDNNDTEQPQVVATVAIGCRLIRADLIPVDVTDAKKLNVTTILGTETAGSLAAWPQEYQALGTVNAPWDGQLADGRYAPEGVYKVSIKALRIFGDPGKREDYDEVETVKLGIRYAMDV